MKKITKTFYVRSDDLEKLQRKKNSEVFLYSSELDQPAPDNPIEITFSMPEKTATLSESEFDKLFSGDFSYRLQGYLKERKQKLFGESND